MEWKNLLGRDDLVDGEIQVVLKDNGVYRSLIKAVEVRDGTVYFKSERTFKECHQGNKSTWVSCTHKPHYFPTDLKLLGNPDCFQFDLPRGLGWVIVFPKGDSRLKLQNGGRN